MERLRVRYSPLGPVYIWCLAFGFMTILASLIGFDCVPTLKERWFTSAALWIAATGAALVTAMMLLEMLGSFPDWLKRIRLDRLLAWLERPYRGTKQV